MARKRIVVTGMGLISPVGHSVAESWKAILEGRSGIGPITYFDPSPYPTRVAGEVKHFDPSRVLDPKTARRYDRFLHFLLVAAREALEQSGLLEYPELFEETGVLIGSGIGGIRNIEETVLLLHEKGLKYVSPFFVPGSIINMASGLLSIEYGFKGPNLSVVSACSTGNHTIGEGYHMLQRGDARVMIVGGTEASITPLGLAGFCAARALSTLNEPPEAASRPFDRSRDGFVMGEGAGVLVLEPLDQALARGARPLAEIVGYGMSADAYHITAPHPAGEGAYRSMKRALEHAGIPPAEVGYINAHATGTPVGDIIEVEAIVRLFGQNAPPTSSTKSAVGHLLGAAGAIEAIFTIQALRDQMLPPTINFREPEPNDPLDHVPVARPAVFEYALSNAFGFGGTNTTVVFRRYEG
nr:MAG: 3-oxoacyl-[acyl-carrier-protein] synthase 2 [Bacteroidota bacterium]